MTVSGIASAVSEAITAPGERPVSPELVREHNLNELEYSRIFELLGRTPTLTELGVFSALWSEHCCCKHSRPILELFPAIDPASFRGPEEIRGAPTARGLGSSIQVESHRPSPRRSDRTRAPLPAWVEFCGTSLPSAYRPIALLDGLQFGPLGSSPEDRYLFAGVVRGVGRYGDCVGVRPLGGEDEILARVRREPSGERHVRRSPAGSAT